MFRSFCACVFFLIFLAACTQQVKRTPNNALLESQRGQKVHKPEEIKRIPEGLRKEPTVEIKKLYYVIYEQEKLKWKIWAEQAKMYNGERIKLFKLKICANPKEGFCITAEKGDYDSKAGKFVFSDNVHLTTKNKGELFTSYLEYLTEEDILTTSAQVRIIKKGLVIKGKGLLYDLKAGHMKVLKQTKVKIDA